MAVADLIEQTKKPLLARAEELLPAVTEYNEIQDVLARLEGQPERFTSRPRPTAPAAQKRRSAGRPRGTGNRAAEAEKIVKSEPGITIAAIAKRMGIKDNYLYRVMPGLAQEGKVVKRDNGWYPVEETAAA